jgi:hypothetical protein
MHQMQCADTVRKYAVVPARPSQVATGTTQINGLQFAVRIVEVAGAVVPKIGDCE